MCHSILFLYMVGQSNINLQHSSYCVKSPDADVVNKLNLDKTRNIKKKSRSSDESISDNNISV